MKPPLHKTQPFMLINKNAIEEISLIIEKEN